MPAEKIAKGRRRLCRWWCARSKRFGCSEEAIEVHISGELDLVAVPQLWSCLAPLIEGGIEPRPHVVLDLSGLGFMDAAGFGVLVRLANRLRSIGGSMSIRSPQPLVRRVMDLADVGHLLHVESERG